jgi:CsoR family transcriptional regulator, copper-sensing transcriptional repressor
MPRNAKPEAPHAHPRHDGQLDALARIEGQVRGIRNMIEEGRYCMDVLAQTRAVQAALRRIERQVLESHLHSCVHHAFTEGTLAERSQKVGEILDLFDWENGRPGR